ncbi:unnamed protein product, partial [Nesidiocoris tenuis]
MFLGKRCSGRCENSINILRRQAKAAKLESCECTGREDYDCLGIRKNMDTMCFLKKSQHHGVKPEAPPPPVNAGDVFTNEITPGRQTTGAADGRRVVHPIMVGLLLPLFV